MAWRKRLRNKTSSEEESKCMDQDSSIDRLSMLPDELLVEMVDGDWESALDEKTSYYVRWVDHVLSLNNNSTLESFRVSFNFNKTNERCIDEWLISALARKVQRLELNLTDNASLRSNSYREFYTFPYKILHTDKEDFRPCNSIHFEYLKKISLSYVNVNGEALEFFLCNCPLLEDLSVTMSGELSVLKIDKPFPSFKRLELSCCPNLSSVVIRDANLVYLKYEGSRINFVLQNVPLLVELCVGGDLTDHASDVLFLFSSILPQLEIFKIYLSCQLPWRDSNLLYSTVKMSNLKQLVVNVDLSYDDSLIPITRLLCASPSLQRFVLEQERDEPKYVKRKVRKIVRPYPHLKEVEFWGYCGTTSDVELVMHLLENAVALENIVVNPCEVRDSYYDYVINKDWLVKAAKRGRAPAKKQLPKIVPPGVTLNIL